MWIFKYFVCLIKDHNWIGSHNRYCLRCGKLEIAPEPAQTNEMAGGEPS
jgi:hypothetical protein